MSIYDLKVILNKIINSQFVKRVYKYFFEYKTEQLEMYEETQTQIVTAVSSSEENIDIDKDTS